MTGTGCISRWRAVAAVGVVLAVGLSCFAVGDYAGIVRADTMAQHQIAAINARIWEQQTAYNSPEYSHCNGTATAGVSALDPKSLPADGYNQSGSTATLYLADPSCTNGEIIRFNREAAANGLDKRLCREIEDPLTGLDVATGAISCTAIAREI